MKNNYFPNLNGLRFFSALAVIIHHTEQIKSWIGIKNSWHNGSINLMGKLGVVMFFVLSGFLITYLLLEEKSYTRSISVKKFYIRRILRIWPLYFLIIILSFFLFPKIQYLEVSNWQDFTYQNFIYKISLYIFFLPNLVPYLFAGGYYCGICWSIGQEEQFYLVWPWLVKKFKNIEIVGWFLIIIYNLIKIGFIISQHYFVLTTRQSALISFYNDYSIDCMIFGGLLAYYHYTNHKIIKLLFHKNIQTITIAIIFTLLTLGIRPPNFYLELYGLFFGIIVLNLAVNKDSIIDLEHKILNYLGKISYGIYIYHFVIVVFVIKTLNHFSINNYIVQYMTILLIVILVSNLSYNYFENYFLKKKNSF